MKMNLQEEEKAPPTFGEFFDRIHKHAKGKGGFVDEKAKSISEKYQSTIEEKYGPDPESHPEFDDEVFRDVVGGNKKARSSQYGFGTSSVKLLGGTQEATSSLNHGPSQFETEIRAEVADLRKRVGTIETTLVSMVGNQEEIGKILTSLNEYVRAPPPASKSDGNLVSTEFDSDY